MSAEQIIELIEKETVNMGRAVAHDFMQQVRDEINIRLEALCEDDEDDED
jgi:hypothetical protein